MNSRLVAHVTGMNATPGPYEVCLMTCVGGPAPVVCSSDTGAQIASLALNPNAEADAFLLAAAPDLLAACWAARAYVASHTHKSSGERLKQVEAAIAKALGRVKHADANTSNGDQP